MALGKFWVIAFRDLVRNRRRTLLTLLAIALGLTVIIIMSSMISGVLEGGLRDNIRINTGHLQVRAESYEIEKMSLLARDLLPDSASLVAQAKALGGVQSAAPVLWTNGVLSTPQESTGLQVTGINPEESFHDPIRQGIVAGEYISADSRGQILIGASLAREMDIQVGQRVSLAAGSADGTLEEGIFTVSGLFNTGFPSYDQGTVIMPLSQAQAFTRTGDRVSSIIVFLDDQEDTSRVAAAMQGPGLQVLTWEDLNKILLSTMDAGLGFYNMIYAIVILVVAVLIANTLLMSVFERTREMGILASLGMKGRQIMVMFLFEAAILALVGIAIGFVLGFAGATYMVKVGISIGEEMASMVEGMALGSKLYGSYEPVQAIVLAFFMFAIVTLVSLYPAWYAARLEPVKALHAL